MNFLHFRRTKSIGGGPRGAKRPRTEAGPSRTPTYDAGRFLSEEHSYRFQKLRYWPFIEERAVELADDEYPGFLQAVLRLKWSKLANPIRRFDPSVVREFYANAMTSRPTLERKSWVRGKEVDYSRDAINIFLGSPFEKEMDYYHRRIMDAMNPFDCDRTAAELCLPGQTYQTGKDGRPLRIQRRCLQTLPQIWGSFLLSNVVPRSHVSDLVMKHCHLIYCIRTRKDVDIAKLISDEIHKFVSKKGEVGALGFPALITDLCKKRDIPVNLTEDIRNPINRTFVEHNCLQIGEMPEGRGRRRHAQRVEEPAAAAAADHGLSSRVEEKLDRVMRQMASIHRGQAHLYSTLRAQQAGVHIHWLTDEQFAHHVQWPLEEPVPHTAEQQQPPPEEPIPQPVPHPASPPCQHAPEPSLPPFQQPYEPSYEPYEPPQQQQPPSPPQHERFQPEPELEQSQQLQASPIAAVPESSIPATEAGDSSPDRPTGTELVDIDEDDEDCADTATTSAQPPAPHGQGEVDTSLQSMLDYDIDMSDVLGSALDPFDLGGGL